MTMPASTTQRMRMRDQSGQVIGTGHLRLVPVADIKIDSHYQRDLNQEWVNASKPWDPKQGGTIILSTRAGGPYCIDGQGRVAIARESGVATVSSFLIDGLTQAEEAALFVRLNVSRRSLKSWDLFKGELAAGMDEAIALVRITTACGYRVERQTTGVTHIVAIDALRRAYRLSGAEGLTRVLSILRAQWFGEEKSTSGQIIFGMALFLESSAKHPRFDEARVAKVTTMYSPTRVLREAQAVAEKRRAIQSSSTNVAEALLNLYNRGLGPNNKIPALMISGKRRAVASRPKAARAR